MSGRKLFGTDGVRGVANRHPILPEVALRLGMAAGAHFRAPAGRQEGRHRIVIGKDTRLSGYMIESALEAGITSLGADVILVGPLPTPAIAFITRALRADAGVVISASHNPYPDNGIKFFGPDGRKLPDAVERRLEELMDSLGDDDRPVEGGVGRASRLVDAEGRYIEYAKATLPKGMTFEGLKLVVDGAHGAAYKVAPAVFRELGARVVTMGDRPDGLNINHECGATHPEAMSAAVVENGADAGLSLDGDGDRAIMADETGALVDGDDLLFISARALAARGELTPAVVVGTEMSNLGLTVALRREGIALLRSAVGDRYVLEEMLRTGSRLGGEASGHVIHLDHTPTGDGIITALQTLRVMMETGKPLSNLRQGWTRFPQRMTNIRVKEKVPFGGKRWVEELTREAEAVLGPDRILSLRYSGTEPLLRVTVSCADPAAVESVSEKLCQAFVEKLGK